MEYQDQKYYKDDIVYYQGQRAKVMKKASKVYTMIENVRTQVQRYTIYLQRTHKETRVYETRLVPENEYILNRKRKATTQLTSPKVTIPNKKIIRLNKYDTKSSHCDPIILEEDVIIENGMSYNLFQFLDCIKCKENKPLNNIEYCFDCFENNKQKCSECEQFTVKYQPWENDNEVISCKENKTPKTYYICMKCQPNILHFVKKINKN